MKRKLLWRLLSLMIAVSLSFPIVTMAAEKAVSGPGASLNRKDSPEAEYLRQHGLEDGRISKALETSAEEKEETQLLLLVDHYLSLWEKDESGHFQKSFSAYAGYGRNGLKKAEERKEGDGTTPIGSFPVLFAFGRGEKIDSSLPYRRITEQSYWSSEQASYNCWVESEVPVEGEHLIDYDICYEYALALGFNMNPVVYGRGSAIFLHLKDPASWDSSGCISIEKEDMEKLLKILRKDSKIVVLKTVEELEGH